ncbi:hypothetical protein [Saccharopolyspora sp. CA-218241]|uniref:hypothetical protein n=1 Tax=Saccharopolyspora sp. CA-218241 TaxID=3240027 RepID=UPI003D956A40
MAVRTTGGTPQAVAIPVAGTESVITFSNGAVAHSSTPTQEFEILSGQWHPHVVRPTGHTMTHRAKTVPAT